MNINKTPSKLKKKRQEKNNISGIKEKRMLVMRTSDVH